MAREKKLYEHKFDDQTVNWPSSVKVKCTVNGREYGFWHKTLAGMIKNKYCNSYAFFFEHYISKDAKMDMSKDEKKDRQKKLRVVKKIDEEDERKPRKYKLHLLLAHRTAEKTNNHAEMAKLSHRFLERYEEDITKAEELEKLDEHVAVTF